MGEPVDVQLQAAHVHPQLVVDRVLLVGVEVRDRRTVGGGVVAVVRRQHLRGDEGHAVAERPLQAVGAVLPSLVVGVDQGRVDLLPARLCAFPGRQAEPRSADLGGDVRAGIQRPAQALGAAGVTARVPRGRRGWALGPLRTDAALGLAGCRRGRLRPCARPLGGRAAGGAHRDQRREHRDDQDDGQRTCPDTCPHPGLHRRRSGRSRRAAVDFDTDGIDPCVGGRERPLRQRRSG
jgi:hypothetical protein